MKTKILSLLIFSGLLISQTGVLAADAPGKVDLQKIDSDQDGMSDWKELFFYKTDPYRADTDGDGFGDMMEIENGYSPHDRNPGIKFVKRIEVDTKKQELSYYFDNKKISTFKVSTGKPSMPTPKGNFKIKNKYDRAWSKKYGLWMPFWMGLGTGSFGFHELPEWPNGYKEGRDHLGKAVSHGCIRLGIGQAELLYRWADVGTPVAIK
jgi:hypothetical protein